MFYDIFVQKWILSNMRGLPVTVTIIALNEEEKIAQAVESALWAAEVLVVDSGSTDKTREIAARLGARVLIHGWEGYGQQKNYAQDQASYDWVLNLDADEVVSLELREEIFRLFDEGLGQIHQDFKTGESGFLIPRKTFYLGKWIRRGGWYPNYLVRLVHRKRARWSEPHVHEELRVHQGVVKKLSSPLLHYAFSSIEDQIQTNLRFSRLGSEDLRRKGKKPSLIRLIFKPIGKFFETFLLKRGFLDGLRGFIISVNAAHSMFLKYAFLSETEMKRENTDH